MEDKIFKTCLSCGKTIQGRIDKKFCDDYCRNVFNNQLKAASSSQIRNINNTLKKNRNILAAAMDGRGNVAKTTREELLQAGFHFKYLTHTQTNRKGNVYGYCYDYGYMELENDWFLVVKEK